MFCVDVLEESNRIQIDTTTNSNMGNSHEEESQECIPLPGPCFHPFDCFCPQEKVR